MAERKDCKTCIFSGRPSYIDPCTRCKNSSQWEGRNADMGVGTHNEEGYHDPTPYKALKAKRNELDAVDAKRMEAALKSAKLTFSEAGFEVVGRIVLRNIRTGKIFK